MPLLSFKRVLPRLCAGLGEHTGMHSDAYLSGFLFRALVLIPFPVWGSSQVGINREVVTDDVCFVFETQAAMPLCSMRLTGLHAWLNHAALRSEASTRATSFKSATNLRISNRRFSLSGARRIEEGWTVAMTFGARLEMISSPRCRVTRKFRPSNVCAALAPRHTSTSG